MEDQDVSQTAFPVVRLIQRALHDDPFGRTKCWDLMIEDFEGSCLLPDIATSDKTAMKIFLLFKENKVGSVNAENVMEDLLGNVEYLD